MFDRIDLRVDVPSLVEYLRLAVFNSHPPVWQKKGYGGWSVLSSNADYRDGWQRGHTAFDENGNLDIIKAGSVLGIDETFFNKPTQLYTGHLAMVMDKVKSFGFVPYRSRVAILKAGVPLDWHFDGYKTERWRLHIPLLTNPDAKLEVETSLGHVESFHAPADGGGYLMCVSLKHRAIDLGTTDRVHLYMGVKKLRERQ